MPQLYRLWAPNGSTSNGLQTYVNSHGWDAAYQQFDNTPFIAVDDLIEDLPYLVVLWGMGQRDGTGLISGTSLTGDPFECAMRGPWNADSQGMVGFAEATRKRTDRCRALGGRSILYIAAPPLLPSWEDADSKQLQLFDWARLLRAAKFDGIAFDGCGTLQQPAGRTTAFDFARYLALRDEFEVIIEPLQPQDASIAPWYDGTFSSVSSLTLYNQAIADNWYGPATPDSTRRDYVLFQADTPLPDRITQANSVTDADLWVDQTGIDRETFLAIGTGS